MTGIIHAGFWISGSGSGFCSGLDSASGFGSDSG
jgi:hypothetical protein